MLHNLKRIYVTCVPICIYSNVRGSCAKIRKHNFFLLILACKSSAGALAAQRNEAKKLATAICCFCAAQEFFMPARMTPVRSRPDVTQTKIMYAYTSLTRIMYVDRETLNIHPKHNQHT